MVMLMMMIVMMTCDVNGDIGVDDDNADDDEEV